MLTWNHARQLVVGVIGCTIIAFGALLLVLPGPGMVVIPIGLAVLGTEFVWARRLLKRVKQSAIRMTGAVRSSPEGTSTPKNETE